MGEFQLLFFTAMLRILLLSVVMLSVSMLSVVMHSVLAPKGWN